MGKSNDLTIEEKAKIDVLTKNAFNNNQIANEIHKHKSCISRYINKKTSIKGKVRQVENKSSLREQNEKLLIA